MRMAEDEESIGMSFGSRMKIYQISCFSECGSYFQDYLQYVDVRASSPEEARSIVKKWMKDTGNEFIYSEDKWQISEILENPCVLNYTEGSDC